MKSTIIIPFFNGWNLTHARLMEIYQYCPSSDVVLVNDASTESDCETGPAWWQNGPLSGRLKYYKHNKNLGFGQSMNVGAAIAILNGADVIVLLSNDVIVGSDIGKEAIEVVNSYNQHILIGAQYLLNNTGWNDMDGVGIVPYLNGWLLACHKDVWKVLGGFDKLYGRADFEDVDLSTSAWYMGIKLVTFGKAKVQHIGGQTVNRAMPQRYSHTIMNREKWLKKWEDKHEELRKAIYGR